MIQSKLGGLTVGEKVPPRIMGVINLSPESFYQGSIKTQIEEVIRKARQMEEAGADIIDLGGMSTAPYKETFVSETEELERVLPTVKALKEQIDAKISVDTKRAKVAEKTLEAGASIINDVSGFKHDEEMAPVITDYGASAIVMAKGVKVEPPVEPIEVIRGELEESLEIGRKNGINEEKMVIDPGIGFWRREHTGWDWMKWDTYVLNSLKRLYPLEKAICVGVSRKSFIGKILGLEDPKERLIGSVAAEAIAIMQGAHLIRTHNVSETRQAVKMAEAIRKGRKTIENESVMAEELPRLKRNDLAVVLRNLNVHEGGVEIMKGKGVSKNLLLQNIPLPLALILKQEMLANGGEAALPEQAILGKNGNADILLMGTINQLKTLAKKLKQMYFSYLEGESCNASDLAEIILYFLP